MARDSFYSFLRKHVNLPGVVSSRPTQLSTIENVVPNNLDCSKRAPSASGGETLQTESVATTTILVRSRSGSPATSVSAPHEIVQNYSGFEVIGEGTYGVVYKAKCKGTGWLVALKKIRLTTDEHSEKLASTGISTTAIREILLLRELKHENVVELLNVSFSQSPFIQLWLTFEFCPLDLRQFVKCIAKCKKLCLGAPNIPEAWESSGGLPNCFSRKFSLHILAGIEFIHNLNILHRDLKPQNILMWLPPALINTPWDETDSNLEISRLMDSSLVTTMDDANYFERFSSHIPGYGPNGLATIKVLNYWSECVAKIADLGLARSHKLVDEQLTQEVVTLWYRPPELLLGASDYSRGVDMWSFGCILAEMVSGKPLFAGDSEVDTLFKIFQILGTPPNPSCFGDGDLPYFREVFPNWKVEDKAASLHNVIYIPEKHTNTNTPLIDLILKCLDYNPVNRISATAAIGHPFFEQ